MTAPVEYGDDIEVKAFGVDLWRWFASGAEYRAHPFHRATSGQPYHERRRVRRPRAPVVIKLELDLTPVVEGIEALRDFLVEWGQLYADQVAKTMTLAQDLGHVIDAEADDDCNVHYKDA